MILEYKRPNFIDEFKPDNTVSYMIRNMYGFSVKDTQPIRNIMTENEKFTLHRICERSSNNKFIRVDISSDNVKRHVRFIKFGSDIAKSLDPNRKMHMW